MLEQVLRGLPASCPKCGVGLVQLRTLCGYSSIDEIRPVLKRINFVHFVSLAGHWENFDLLQPVSPQEAEVTRSWRSSLSEDGDKVHLVQFLAENRFVLVHDPLYGPAHLAIEVTPAEAVHWLMKHCPEERRLKGVSAIYHDSGRITSLERGEPPAAVMAEGSATSGTTPEPSAENSLVKALQMKKRSKQALLVEFMIGKDSAKFEDLTGPVHGHPKTTNDAVEKNARATSDSAASLGFRIRYLPRCSMIFKEIAPE